MKRRVHKAFVLAAGFGTRMLPLTRAVPKPLLPLWGVPLIDRTLDMLSWWGVTDVVVNVHHGSEKIIRHLIEHPRDGMRISISHEPEILGTGGALVKAAWFFDDGEPFWMVNADVGADVDIRPVMRAFRPGKTIASAWLMATRGPRTVECEKGVITNFRTRRPGTDGTFTFCGIHLVDPAILRFLPRQGFASIVTAYENAMKREWFVAGVPIEKAWWSDLGTPGQYLQAHRETAPRKRGAFAVVSKDAEVSGHAELKDSVVLDGASIGPRVRAANMIFGPGVRATKCSGVITMRAVDALTPAERAVAAVWEPRLDRVVASALAPRGSSRTFTRLYSGARSAILVSHDPSREENDLYARHARFLRKLGVPVPSVIAEDERNHVALYEDVGERTVQDEAQRLSSVQLEKIYTEVIESLVIFHEKGKRAARRQGLPLMPTFDRKLYAWEHGLFLESFLKGRIGLPTGACRLVQTELDRVAKKLLKLPRVLVHRDLQSSNIMLKGREWALIDFQGMRLGPAVYDLASLLCDPYIEIDGDLRDRLLYHYARRAKRGAEVRASFGYAVVQRLGQAIGAYVNLSKRAGMEHFASYIGSALAKMAWALEASGEFPKLSRIVRDCRDAEC